jgi:peptide/nickel transport system permease protein
LRGLALVGVAIPIFFMGMLLQFTIGYLVPIFPTTGFKTYEYGNPEYVTGFRIIDSFISGEFYYISDYLYHLVLPVACLSFIVLAGITRQSRSSMLEVLEQDYVRTARAKGCKEKDVINTHARKNSLIPTVTVIGLSFAGLLSGAVLTETTFGLVGLGELLIASIRDVDYWVLNALVFVITIMFVSINLVTDIIYAMLDPRIVY